MVAGVAVTVAGALAMLVWDPTRPYQQRLDTLEHLGGLPAAATTHAGDGDGDDTSLMASQPIFVMTTGPGAYKEKTLQIFGVAISPGRHAALVSVDGAEPVWMVAGEVNGDIRLTAVGTNGASFDTPVGPRTVTFNDAPPSSASAAGG